MTIMNVIDNEDIDTCMITNFVLQKRKITEDDSGHTIAKRLRTHFEQSVSETDIDRDNVSNLQFVHFSHD